MSAISGTSGSSSSYVPSSSSANDDEEDDKTTAAEESEKTDSSGDAESSSKTESTTSQTDAEKLAAYKKQFIASLQSALNKPYLANMSLQLNITDAGFKKMMSDESYAQKVKDLFESKTGHSYVSMSGTIAITADGTSDNTKVEVTQDLGMTRRLFGNSPRSVIRSTSIDSLTALAQATITSRETSASKFSLASSAGATQMRTANSYLNAYLEKAGLLDTTG